MIVNINMQNSQNGQLHDNGTEKHPIHKISNIIE